VPVTRSPGRPAGGAPPVPQGESTPRSDPPSETPLRVGLVGMGFIGAMYQRALRELPGVELVAVADPDEGALRSVGGMATTRHPDALLDDPAIDCVCILTPHHLHAQQAIRALRGGKHVLTEKPLALSLAGAREVCRAAEEAGRHLIVRQYLRHAPFVAQLHQAVRGGGLGNVVAASFSYTTQQLATLQAPESWRSTWDRAGGGVLMDIGVHVVDLLQLLFGRGEVRAAVCERLRTPDPRRAEDHAVVVLGYDDGPLATLTLTNCDSSGTEPRWWWELLGEGGRFEAEGSWRHVRWSETTPGGVTEHERSEWWEAANRASVADALRTIRTEAPGAASGAAAAENLRVLLDAYRRAGIATALELAG